MLESDHEMVRASCRGGPRKVYGDHGDELGSFTFRVASVADGCSCARRPCARGIRPQTSAYALRNVPLHIGAHLSHPVGSQDAPHQDGTCAAWRELSSGTSQQSPDIGTLNEISRVTPLLFRWTVNGVRMHEAPSVFCHASKVCVGREHCNTRRASQMSCGSASSKFPQDSRKSRSNVIQWTRMHLTLSDDVWRGTLRHIARLTGNWIPRCVRYVLPSDPHRDGLTTITGERRRCLNGYR
jgi:hypothetical protein